MRMNKFSATHHRNKYLEPMTDALEILIYDVHVMCVPNTPSSDLPILTDGNAHWAKKPKKTFLTEVGILTTNIQ